MEKIKLKTLRRYHLGYIAGATHIMVVHFVNPFLGLIVGFSGLMFISYLTEEE